MNASLRGRIQAGEVTVGTFLNLGSPLAAEACALAGFDWLLVDLEHGGGGEDALIGQLLAAAAHDVPVLVRVESDERIRSGRVLDAGAAGVMYPRLDSAEQVAAAVRHLRYPPAGDRGVATYNRAAAFGTRPGRLETANDAVVGVVQIESVAALDDVEAIAQLPGVPGRLDAPEFRAALSRVVAAAQAAGVSAGILARDHDGAQRFAGDGFTFLGVGSDSTLLAAAAQAAAAPLGAMGGHP